MFTMAIPSNQLLYSTTRITAFLVDGRASVGTAFFFNFRLGKDRFVPVLITNKHVIDDATSGEFRLHRALTDEHGQAKASGQPISVTLDSFADRWVQHPHGLDLCAMPVAPLQQQAQAQGTPIFSVSFDESLIPDGEVLQSLGAIEDVVMIGYPSGLWDTANNFPIVRRGITASHPAVDFDGKPHALVDIASFPGSSGSPVILFNVGSYATEGGTVIGNRALLLGALYAGPQFTAEGQIKVVNTPTATFPVVSTNLPLHLGYYLKSREILSLGRHMFTTLNIN